MEIHVYDTYVEAADGHTMHFDVFTKEKNHDKAIEYAKQWLGTVDQGDSKISTEECTFCHTQEAPPHVEEEIEKNGFFIYKMEGCT